MSDEKTSILLSDVSVDGEVIEKDKIIIDAKINGDIKADDIITIRIIHDGYMASPGDIVTTYWNLVRIT